MNGIFRFLNGDVVDALTNVRSDGHPVETVHWSTGEVFWLNVVKYRYWRRVVYDEVPTGRSVLRHGTGGDPSR